MSDANTTQRRPWVGWSIGVVVAVVAGTAIGWAATTALTPPPDVLDSTQYTFVEVAEGEVGSSINLNTVAEWVPRDAGSNLASGVVTTVNISPGQDVGPSTVLYTVNLRPVVIAQGDVPAFRSLAVGTSGADVSQLQSMLTSLGLYKDAVDGKFDWVTKRSVEAWQKSLGIAVDGTVQAGDIIFVPTLPTRVALDDELIKRGQTLGGGEDVVRELSGAPSFTIPATASQAALMPTGTRVEITGPSNESWEGFVTDQTANTLDDGITIALGGRDGAPICGDACSSISVIDKSLLQSRIVTVETAAGATVPSAALLSKANGSLAVIDDEGNEHIVTVVASARGMSIVEGVPLGSLVRVPASEG